MQYTKQQQLGKRSKPKRKDRTRIKPKEYQRAVNEWGNFCSICGMPYPEMHHVKFRSSEGKGKYRNLRPLCKAHHQLAHQDREFRQKLEREHEYRYSLWYWADEHDLYEMGIIAEPTEEAYERYFERVGK